jgi:hypothetical protein
MRCTHLLVAASSPATQNSRTQADTILAYVVVRGSATRLARRIDAGGASVVNAAIAGHEVCPAHSNRPGARPRSGHGVTIVYAGGRTTTVSCDG